MTPLEILKEARAKIADPAMWGQGGRPERPRFDSCCAAEAIEEVVPFKEFGARHDALEMFKCAAGIGDEWGDFVSWNDAPDRTHSEVLATFNLAIALERNMPRSRA